MEHSGFLLQAAVYFAAAVIAVMLSHRLGLGSVAGYLLAGIAIGPWGFRLVGQIEDVRAFAELGVVFLLFVIGLELEPRRLWSMRTKLIGLGASQVLGSVAVIVLVAGMLGVDWKAALVAAMALSLSSTALALQPLSERGALGTPGGQATFAILLFQDLAVIPMLAVMPMLGGTAERPPFSGRDLAFAIAAIVLTLVLGHFLARPVFRHIARTRLREIFTAFALLLVLGIALVFEHVGLSMALGAFLAGVLLAESEYRHEIEAVIEPFKGLLLGLFFISVGAQIDFALIASQPLRIAGLVLGTMVLKLAVLHALGRIFGLDRPARWLLALALAQVGEFAFVLLSIAVQDQIFSPALAGMLVATVAISMVLTPPAFILLERVILPHVTDRAAERPQDEIVDADTPVVIAGFGRFGQMVGRLLRANRIPLTILDLDPEMVDILGRLGIKVYYGDASRVDLLHAAGCARAKLFVLAVDDAAVATRIAESVRQHFPHLTILARCVDRPHYFALRKLGVRKVFRETFGSAHETAIEALKHLGYRAHTAHRLARRWRDHEESVLEELGDLWRSDRATYFQRARGALDEAERLMRDEDPSVYLERDAGWDNESLRADNRPDAAALDARDVS
ncbi:MAG TPA: monovalent cation:proton antiporter-2 (CPA2) family protein [Kofleriaceae bacterium]|nr:monovalent cation:proton antiporter-2 (CPA2) family protein [Kofleriaceae bacterium]